MLTVAYCLRYYPTLTETFVVREIEALLARGIRVIVVAMGTRADGALATKLPDVQVLRARSPSRSLRRQLRTVDRIHAHFDGEASGLAQQLSARLGVPYTVTVHAVDLFRPHPGITARLRGAEAVFTVCGHHQRWLAEHHGVTAEVARCGVEVPLTQADPSIQPPRVLAVARDVPKKDLDRLRRVGVPHLQILDHAPQSEVQSRLAQAQIYALPCRVAPDGDRDGVPVSIMEAMALGLPVVTRPVSGIPELVDASVGWIDADFERALRQACESPAERVQRGRAARARIREDWGLHTGADTLLRAWGRVVLA